MDNNGSRTYPTHKGYKEEHELSLDICIAQITKSLDERINRYPLCSYFRFIRVLVVNVRIGSQVHVVQSVSK